MASLHILLASYSDEKSSEIEAARRIAVLAFVDSIPRFSTFRSSLGWTSRGS